MQSFYSLFPEIAEKETRCLLVCGEQEGLPNGEYFFIESFCNDKKCDCRRVFINVLYKENIVATIGYGWENIEFYEKWLGEKALAKDAKGPILELTGKHTNYSESLLRLFKKSLLMDRTFLRRLGNHYTLFKEELPEEEKNAEEDIEEELDNFDPDSFTVIELCTEIGTGFDTIQDNNKEAFYPLLWSIEESIASEYAKDPSLKDSEVITLLKNLRDKIFSENPKWNECEEKIVTKLKYALYMNDYTKKDLSLSISCVLNSTKLHRSIDGSRGYVQFISTFFDEMKNGSKGEEK